MIVSAAAELFFVTLRTLRRFTTSSRMKSRKLLLSLPLPLLQLPLLPLLLLLPPPLLPLLRLLDLRQALQMNPLRPLTRSASLLLRSSRRVLMRFLSPSLSRILLVVNQLSKMRFLVIFNWSSRLLLKKVKSCLWKSWDLPCSQDTMELLVNILRV